MSDPSKPPHENQSPPSGDEQLEGSELCISESEQPVLKVPEELQAKIDPNKVVFW